jgi:hypothetical protein
MSQQLVGDGDLTITQAQNRAYALAEGFHRMTTSKISNTWPLFMRYKVLTEREYRRALEDFERLKALRHELPNEPISDAQPEPTETTCDPLATDPFPPQDSAQTGNHTSNDHSGGTPPMGDRAGAFKLTHYPPLPPLSGCDTISVLNK